MARNNFKMNGVEVMDVIHTMNDVTIVAKQNKPEEVVCPHCGKSTSRMRYTRPRVYKDSPLLFSKDTYLSIKRVEAKCECGKSFTVQSNLVKENSRMTTNLVQFIKFLLENPYNMTNEEMAAEAGVSEKTIRRARKGV